MELRVGSRWKSAVCETEVIVVRAGSPVEIECGGHAMIPVDAERPNGAAVSDAFRDGTKLGKRYVEEDAGLELLCTKGGEGSLSVGGKALTLKEAKPLPSSD